MRRVTKTRGPWEVAAIVRHKSSSRPLAVTIDPYRVTCRPKGTRKGFSLTWGAIYALAAQAEADTKRREKAQARKSKRTTKRGMFR